MKNNTEMVLGIEGFEQKPHIVLAWLCNNPFSAQIKKIKGQRNREREKGKEIKLEIPLPSSELCSFPRDLHSWDARITLIRGTFV